jgi:hypothetical protein
VKVDFILSVSSGNKHLELKMVPYFNKWFSSSKQKSNKNDRKRQSQSVPATVKREPTQPNMAMRTQNTIQSPSTRSCKRTSVFITSKNKHAGNYRKFDGKTGDQGNDGVVMLGEYVQPIPILTAVTKKLSGVMTTTRSEGTFMWDYSNKEEKKLKDSENLHIPGKPWLEEDLQLVDDSKLLSTQGEEQSSSLYSSRKQCHSQRGRGMFMKRDEQHEAEQTKRSAEVVNVNSTVPFQCEQISSIAPEFTLAGYGYNEKRPLREHPSDEGKEKFKYNPKMNRRFNEEAPKWGDCLDEKLKSHQKTSEGGKVNEYFIKNPNSRSHEPEQNDSSKRRSRNNIPVNRMRIDPGHKQQDEDNTIDDVLSFGRFSTTQDNTDDCYTLVPSFIDSDGSYDPEKGDATPPSSSSSSSTSCQACRPCHRCCACSSYTPYLSYKCPHHLTLQDHAPR